MNNIKLSNGVEMPVIGSQQNIDIFDFTLNDEDIFRPIIKAMTDSARVGVPRR